MQSILSVQNVVKQFHNHRACDGISFEMPQGSIFGLLGPNGAGKTSLIRIITAISKADEGEIYFGNKLLNDEDVRDIGYMPEERGLYKKMKVGEHIRYIAQLRGLSKKETQDAVSYWYEKFDIADWENKKIEELSKGMQQKVQFVVTVIHNPKLLILDEPFSGLDPVNSNLIRDQIFELNQKGTSIIFSTHRMEQVEEICDSIVLINKGQKLLNGSLVDIKNEFKENKFIIETETAISQELQKHIFPEVVDTQENKIIFKLGSEVNLNQVIQKIISENVQIRSINEILPSLNEIFIKSTHAG